MYGHYSTTAIPTVVPIPVQLPTSTSPNLIRVEFERSYGNSCGGTAVKIERRFPNALQSYLSATTWTDFCDQVDRALIQINKALRVSNTIAFLSFLSFFILIIVQIVIFTGVVRYSPIPTYDDSSNNALRFIPIFFIIAFILIFTSMCFRSCYLARAGSSTETQITKICTDFSSRYPSLNIHFRPVQYHYSTHRHSASVILSSCIEIELPNPSSSTTTTTETSVSYNLDHPITIATPAFSEKDSMNTRTFHGKTLAQRMADLESIRSMISEQEYSKKRQEILSEISMTVKSVAERLADLETIQSMISEQEYRVKRQEILFEV